MTSPFVHFRVDSNNIYHGQHYARVDLNPMPKSALFPSQGLWIWPLMSSSFEQDSQVLMTENKRSKVKKYIVPAVLVL
jgi:hypothetical protein